MDVAVIYDNELTVAKIVPELAGRFRVCLWKLDTCATHPSLDAAVYIFCSSLITNEQFRRARQAVETCAGENSSSSLLTTRKTLRGCRI